MHFVESLAISQLIGNTVTERTVKVRRSVRTGASVSSAGTILIEFIFSSCLDAVLTGSAEGEVLS